MLYFRNMTVFTVTDFIAHINDVLSRSWDQEALCIEGEVCQFRVSQGQWINFDLKDDSGQVNVFMTAWQLRLPLEDGLKVRVYGVPRIYPKFGKFSLTAARVELVGEGALKKALALLKAKLEAEGLFEPSRKRTLPIFPQRIALVASRESAAYGDFVRIVNERWRGLEIHSYHVKVQGQGAADDIIKAIRSADAHHEGYDALILTRGGGSLEELMAFNDEQLVRAIHACKTPTLVGIGHERDITLAELAADVRGSTPTDCARRLVPDRKDVLRDLSYLMEKTERCLRDDIKNKKDFLNDVLRTPASWLATQGQRLEALSFSIGSNMQQWVKVLAERLRQNCRLLASLDPKGVLKRGYSILRAADGKAIVSTAALSVGQGATIVLQDGESDVRIERVRADIIAKQQKLL